MSTAIVLDKKDKFLVNFEGQDFTHEAKAFIRVREAGLRALKNLEFPTTKEESWKYTRLDRILKHEFDVQRAINIDSVEEFLIPELNANVLVFINGFYVPKFSKVTVEDKENIIVSNLDYAKEEHEDILEPIFGQIYNHRNSFFSSLNTAYSQDGVFVYLKDNVELEKPVHVISITEGEETSIQPRHLIVAGKGSKAEVLFTYHSIGDQFEFVNEVSEIHVKENANISINKIQSESDKCYHFTTDFVQQDSNSNFSINTFTFSGSIVRNNLEIIPQGENIETHLNGLYFLNGKQHVDNHTLVDHVKPNCVSHELYKGVVTDNSTGVFNGKVFVRKDAQNTNAFQSNANILLSDDATVDSKPELEIYADNVKCSHGSTTGQFDDEAIFYLRSRGIREHKARQILVEAFFGEVIEKVENEAIAEKISALVENKFNLINASQPSDQATEE